MSGKNRVYCLYNCKNGNYQILKIWDNNGVPNTSALEQLFEERYGRSPDEKVGPFESLEELQRFLFSLAEQWNAGAFHLLLPEELNKCLGSLLFEVIPDSNNHSYLTKLVVSIVVLLK